ncbi:MAG: hypothetical protein HC892_00080 [Saprospiraceae bacterium]|nr:hypothetical protein [Saprospiraceae bacterium]
MRVIVLLANSPETGMTKIEIANEIGMTAAGMRSALHRWRENGLWSLLYDLYISPIVASQSAAELYAAEMYPRIIEKMVRDALSDKTTPTARLNIGAFLLETVVNPMKAEAGRATGTEADYAAQLTGEVSDDDVTIITRKTKKVKAGREPYKATSPLRSYGA